MRCAEKSILRWLLFIGAITLLEGIAFGETISGNVLDAETLAPVRNARVRAEGYRSTKTDEAGFFSIDGNRKGRVRLTATAAGYQESEETLQVPSGGLQDYVVVLFSDSYVGEQIEVTGEVPLKREAIGKQTLNTKVLTRIPGTQGDALRAIRSLPGVANTNAGGAGAGNIVIRGAAPEDSIVTIDGIEIPLLYHFFGLQSILPSEFIQKIDFSPGGFGAEQGRSTGGVLNVKTRSQAPDHYSGFAEFSFINFAALFQGPVSKEKGLYLTGSVRRSAVDLILPAVIPDDANLAFTTAPTYYDGQLQLDWIADAHNDVSVLGLVSYDLLSLINDNVSANEPLTTGGFENETSFFRTIATWRHKRKNFTSKVTLAAGTTGFRVDIGDSRFLRINSKSLELRSDQAWKPKDYFQLRVGAMGRLISSNVATKLPLPPAEGEGGGNFSTAPVFEIDETIQNHVSGAYIATDLRPFDNTNITIGARLDRYYKIRQTTLTPRLSIDQKIGKKWTIKGSVGSYSRAPQQAESIPDNLLPEVATQYVAGVETKIREGITLSSNFFYTDRRQLVVQNQLNSAPDIQGMDGELDINNAYLNSGYGRSFGVESLLRVKFDNFFGWVSYTLSRGDRVDNGDTPRRLFSYDQTHNLVALGSYTLGSWEFGGRFQFSTGVPTTPITGSIYLSDFGVHVPINGVPNSERFPSAHQLDIRIDKKWDFANWDLSVFLDITNIYANAPILAFDYNFDFSEREEVQGLPILPAIGVRGSF